MGFTDYYTAGIWTGYDENNKELANTSYHKSIWKQIMDRIHEELPVRDFSVPDSITQVWICRKSGKLAVSGLCDADPRGAVRSIRNISRREQSLKRCATCISRLPYVRKAVF